MDNNTLRQAVTLNKGREIVHEKINKVNNCTSFTVNTPRGTLTISRKDKKTFEGMMSVLIFDLEEELSDIQSKIESL